MKNIPTFIIAVFALFVIGCQASQGSKTYTPGQAQAPLSVYYGTVLKVSEVTIQGQQTGAGAVGGAVVGPQGRPRNRSRNG